MEKQIINQNVCYFTTPEYLNTFWGRRNLFYCMGSVQLTNTHIRFRSNKIDFDIPMTSIMDVSIGTFEKTQGIFHLNYLAITVSTKSGPKTILLVPAISRYKLPGKINRNIEHWFNTLCNIKGRKYEMFRPYPQTHDWPANINRQTLDSKKDINDDFIQSKLSVLPKSMLILFIIVFFLIMVSFTVAMGIVGFFYGSLICIFFFTTTYIIFWVQSRVLGFIRKNKDENILFNMWAEFEDGEFMGPFKGKK